MGFQDKETKIKRYAIYYRVIYNGRTLDTEVTIRYGRKAREALQSFENDMRSKRVKFKFEEIRVL